MPSKEPPPKDDGGQSKIKPPKFEAPKNDAKPEKNTALIAGIVIVVIGIILYAYFGA